MVSDMGARNRGPRDLLLAFSIAAIALATLIPRDGGAVTQPLSLCLLCGQRGLGDFLSNILLFVPFGFALRRRGWPLLRVVLIGAAASLTIEVAQLGLITGRDPNAGDLLANTLGALVGGLVMEKRSFWRPAAGSPWRAAGIATGVSILLLGALSLFTPYEPDAGQFVVQLAPGRPDMDTYLANVHSVRIGDTLLDTTAAIRRPSDALLGNALEVQAEKHVPPHLAPIVTVHDQHGRELLMLGAAREDLVYRQRMRADELRLDRGDIRVHQAFEVVPSGAMYNLRLRVDRTGYCLELEGRAACGRGFTVGDTWSLLLALDWGSDERAVLRALWLFILFIPPGLPARRRRDTAAAATIAGGLLMSGTLLMGFAPTPAYQLIAVWAGILTGRQYGKGWRTTEETP